MTVAELLARISSRELTEWAVYERRAGPFGGRCGDIQAAIVATAIYNVNRKKDAKPVDQMWAEIRQANAAMGAENGHIA